MVKDAHDFYNTYMPEHERRLNQILTHMKDHGRFLTFSEYLDTHNSPRPTRLLYDIRPETSDPPEYIKSADIVQCNICDAVFSTNVMVDDVCPSCQSVTCHRQFQQMMTVYGNALQGRKVVSFEQSLLQRWGLLSGATSVAPAESVADLHRASPESAEALVALRLINGRADVGTIDEIKRVLKPGGVFVSMTPYTVGPGTQSQGDMSSRFSLDEYVGVLSKAFTVASVPGYDPVSRKAARVFVGSKR
jgi:hypothetical protein